MTYAIGDKPEPIDRSAMPSIFVPLQELENLALNTQYVNVLATRPDFRCRGFGSILLGRARELAGKRRLSIIVSDANKAAMSLYSKHGYTPVDSRPITTVPEWRNDGKNWILMLSQP